MKLNQFLVVILFIIGTNAFGNNLLTKKNAQKWVIVVADKSIASSNVFEMNDGLLKVGNASVGYIRTKKAYKNYELALEWRWTKKAGNSGVLLQIQPNDTIWPVCFQVQQKANAAGDIICMNGLWAKECKDSVKFTVPKMLPSNEKKIGEWNSMRVISQRGTLKVYINGLLQNKISEMTKRKGFIGIQGEGTDMEVRKFEIRKL